MEEAPAAGAPGAMERRSGAGPIELPSARDRRADAAAADAARSGAVLGVGGGAVLPGDATGAARATAAGRTAALGRPARRDDRLSGGVVAAARHAALVVPAHRRAVRQPGRSARRPRIGRRRGGDDLGGVPLPAGSAR